MIHRDKKYFSDLAWAFYGAGIGMAVEGAYVLLANNGKTTISDIAILTGSALAVSATCSIASALKKEKRD